MMGNVNSNAQLGDHTWENPPWSNDPEYQRDLVGEAVALLRMMTPQQRANLLLEFPADEVVAVSDMLHDLS